MGRWFRRAGKAVAARRLYPVDRLRAAGYDKKHGVSLQLSKEASWAAVRDKLASGELDAAHALYGMIYGLHLGIAGPQRAMANLMTLNNNGRRSPCRTS